MKPATYDYNVWNEEEIQDFEYFIKYQLEYIDPVNKVINTRSRNRKNIYYNVGSTRKNGYVVISCNGRNRSKDRFIYYYLYKQLPPTRQGLNKASLPKEYWNIPQPKKEFNFIDRLKSIFNVAKLAII